MNNLKIENNTSPKKIAAASLSALVVAAALMLTLVLPAEFNIDPLGTGKLLGIYGISQDPQQVGALNKQDQPYYQDNYRIVLSPFESLEYKYRLEKGATMLFDWTASDSLLFDMHSEQDGVDPSEYAPSFSQGNAQRETGSFTAPFSGIHGWFWENRSLQTVTLELSATGFFSAATEFRDRYQEERTFGKEP